MNKEFIYFGKIVNTHGIKGELRIISNFDRKDLVLKKEFNLYIEGFSNPYFITGYRHHKNFEMVTLEGFSNINEVLKFVGKKVYIKRSDLDIEENTYLYVDLIDLAIIENNICYGKVVDVIDNNINVLLEISGEHHFYIPHNKEYIKNVDIKNKRIEVENIKGLIL